MIRNEPRPVRSTRQTGLFTMFFFCTPAPSPETPRRPKAAENSRKPPARRLPRFRLPGAKVEDKGIHSLSCHAMPEFLRRRAEAGGNRQRRPFVRKPENAARFRTPSIPDAGPGPPRNPQCAPDGASNVHIMFYSRMSSLSLRNPSRDAPLPRDEIAAVGSLAGGAGFGEGVQHFGDPPFTLRGVAAPEGFAQALRRQRRGVPQAVRTGWPYVRGIAK